MQLKVTKAELQRQLWLAFDEVCSAGCSGACRAEHLFSLLLYGLFLKSSHCCSVLSTGSPLVSEHPFSAKKQLFGSGLVHFVRVCVGFC